MSHFTYNKSEFIPFGDTTPAGATYACEVFDMSDVQTYPSFTELDIALADLAAQSPIPSLLDEMRATITREALKVRTAFAVQEDIPLEDVDVMIEPSPDGMTINVTARRIERGPSPFVAYYPWWVARCK